MRRRPEPSLDVLTVPSGRELARRLPQFLIGIIMLGVGIALMVRSRLGLSPWDVLHQGLAKRTDIALGTIVILVGLVVLLAWIPLRQRFGIGTVINTIGVGLVVNASLDWVARPHGLGLRAAFLVVGIVVTGAGTGLYIGASLGPGPRDGLMTAIARRGVRLWIVRTILELSALGAGYALGGTVGVGTVIFAFAIGPLAHLFLSWFHQAVATELCGGLGPGVTAE